MSTVSTSTTATTATVATTNSAYFDLLKWLAPFLVSFTMFLGNVWYTSQTTAANMTAVNKKIDDFQSAKESRGERLAVLESRVANLEAGQIALSNQISTMDKKFDGKLDTVLSRLPAAK